MGNMDAFATGAFRGLTASVSKWEAKREREKKLKFMQQYMEAVQKYQTDGTAIPPEIAAQAAMYGMQPPGAALKGFDPSVLEGGQDATGMVSPGMGGAPASSASGGQVGGPALDAAALFESGAISGPQAILEKQKEQTLKAQAKARAFWMNELTTAQSSVGNKPVHSMTVDEFQSLFQPWMKVDPIRARQFADEWRTHPTGGGASQMVLSPDEMEDFWKKINEGRSDELDGKQRAYAMKLAPTEERRRFLFDNPFSLDQIRKWGDEGYQARLNELWPFGGLGFPQDKEKWLTGKGTEVSKEKRAFFNEFLFFNGEKNWDATFGLGLERGAAAKKVLDKYNNIKKLLTTLIGATPEQIAQLDWNVIIAELPSNMTLEQFKQKFREAYEAAHGITPNIP